MVWLLTGLLCGGPVAQAIRPHLHPQPQRNSIGDPGLFGCLVALLLFCILYFVHFIVQIGKFPDAFPKESQLQQSLCLCLCVLSLEVGERESLTWHSKSLDIYYYNQHLISL